MAEFIRSILGTYTPVVYSWFDIALNEYHDYIPEGMAGVDWPYVITGIAFLIMLYSVFRILGIFVDKL